MECRDEKHYSVQYETGDIVFTCISAALSAFVISTASQCAGATMLGLLLVIMTIRWRKVVSPFNRHHAVTVYANVQPDNVTPFVAWCGGLTVEQKLAIMEQVPLPRLNKFYHTGFNMVIAPVLLSKFVFDIYKEALCIPVGDITLFEELLHSNPDAKPRLLEVLVFRFNPGIVRR
ncbi:hypothetical protein KCP78_08565 [Salmonella enterica subsp. enterica]|nr:hypothetical protein KCP78_08565 [Salmonella enterica subsp. enterica]